MACPDLAISALTAVLRGSSRAPRCTAVTLVARAVAPAPFDATPDGPTCAAELSAHQPRSGSRCTSLPGDQQSSTSTARSGWLPRPTTTRTSPCSAAWYRGSGGDQALGCPSLMTLERNRMPHALVRAWHHSDSMRWRRQVESAKRGQLSTTRIARPDGVVHARVGQIL